MFAKIIIKTKKTVRKCFCRNPFFYKFQNLFSIDEIYINLSRAIKVSIARFIIPKRFPVYVSTKNGKELWYGLYLRRQRHRRSASPTVLLHLKLSTSIIDNVKIVCLFSLLKFKRPESVKKNKNISKCICLNECMGFINYNFSIVGS